MKKQQILVGFVVLIFCISFSGCTEKNILTDEEKLIGNWAWTQPANFGPPRGWDNITGNITFFKNGTVKLIEYGKWNSSKEIIYFGEYKIKDKLLIIHLYDEENATEGYYSFSNNNQKFILTHPRGNSTLIFEKKDKLLN